MSYTINISGVTDCDGKFVNRTWEALSNDDDNLVELADEVVDWEGEGLDDSGVEAMAAFVRTDDVFYQLEKNLQPMCNFAHILQNSPNCSELLDLAKNAPNVSILEIEELDCTVIALNGCGMDFSDSIAYTYLIVDKFIPSGFDNITEAYTISQEALAKLINAR